jgi:hypothetical protein
MVTVYRMLDDMKNAYRILIRKSKERGHSGDLGINGKIILKCVCEHSNEPFNRIKM